MITGVYKPTAGRCSSTARTSTGKPPHAATERGIGRTFQNIRLFQEMTALENVLVGMHCRLRGGILGGILRTPARPPRGGGRPRARARAARATAASSGKDDEYARNLPYGDQRRLEVARALATEPKLLLLDEPTAGMNPQETAEFTGFIGRLRDERGLTVLLIEHDMKVVMGVSERITVLEYGAEDRRGHTRRRCSENPRVIEAYLGHGAAG